MATVSGSDRLRDLQAFDDTKAGVKGLVDGGITIIPYFFHHKPDPIPVAAPLSKDAAPVIPLVDLAKADADRGRVVAEVMAAAETVGFFQVVNHGVAGELMDEMLAAVRRFNEEPQEAKVPYYTRDVGSKVRFNSNFDLFRSPAANWRDTLVLEMAPEGPSPEQIPPACSGVALEYTAAVRRLGERLFELLSEAMGLPAGYLGRDAGCMDGQSVAAHYYPPCPEPEATMGTSRHTDPSFLTVLLQDTSGGLQALLEGPRRWVDVPPVAGALVVNVGYLLQLVSNNRLRSVEHRVVATGGAGPARVSVACFFRLDYASTRSYGPVVDGNGGARPAVYRSMTAGEFLARYNGKELDGRSALDHLRLPAAAVSVSSCAPGCCMCLPRTPGRR